MYNDFYLPGETASVTTVATKKNKALGFSSDFENTWYF